MKTLFDKFKAIQKIGTEIPIPFYTVARIIHGSGPRSLRISGDQIDLGGSDSDYASLNECRLAIGWFVEQLGGTVTWKALEEKT